MEVPGPLAQSSKTENSQNNSSPTPATIADPATSASQGKKMKITICKAPKESTSLSSLYSLIIGKKSEQEAEPFLSRNQLDTQRIYIEHPNKGDLRITPRKPNDQIMPINHDILSQELAQSPETSEATDCSIAMSVSSFENIIKKLNQVEKLIQELKEDLNRCESNNYTE